MMECKRIGELTIKEVSGENDMDVPGTSKTRKISDGDVNLSPANSVHSKENSASIEPAGSSTSCCSKSLDLEEKVVEVADNEAESGEMESPQMPENEDSPPRQFPVVIQPIDGEVEEFLARCERELLRRFRKKYNFDFEKEEPLEGRYEWVQTSGN